MSETLIPQEEPQETIEPTKPELVPMDEAIKQTFEDALAKNPELGGEWPHAQPIPSLPNGEKWLNWEKDVVIYESGGDRFWQRVRGELKEKPRSDEELEQALPQGLNRTMVNIFFDDERKSWMWQLRPSRELIVDKDARERIEREIENWPSH